MSTCLGKMMIEGEQELAPQFKRMKLTSDNSQGYDIYKAHLIGHDLYNELKMVCPYFTEEVNFFNYNSFLILQSYNLSIFSK